MRAAILAGSITLDKLHARATTSPCSSSARGDPSVHRQRGLQARSPRLIVVGGLLVRGADACRKHRNLLTRPRSSTCCTSPWILPIVLIALGPRDRIRASRGRSWAAFVLTGTPILLLIAYICVKIPFTLRLLKAGFASVPDSSSKTPRASSGAKSLTTLRRVAGAAGAADRGGDHGAELQQPARRLRRGDLPLPPAGSSRSVWRFKRARAARTISTRCRSRSSTQCC